MRRTLFGGLCGILTLLGCSSDAELFNGNNPSELGEPDGPGVATVGDNRSDQTAGVFSEFVDGGPGCSIALRHDGVVDDWQFGLADVERNEPITAETIFDIGSVSKQITGGVIAVMSIDGVLSLNTPITQVFDRLPDGSDEITVSDLVHHVSGLPDYVDLIDAELDEATNADDAFDAIAGASDLKFNPRTEFEYSNTNYFLLAELAGRYADTGFPALATELIFEPLGMTASVVRDDQGELLDEQAVGYTESNGDWAIVSSGWQQTGDGAVHSTPLDLIIWADTFIEPGQSGAIAGSTEWVDLMTSSGPVQDEDGTNYGFGLSMAADGDVVWHGGSWLGYSSYVGIRSGSAVAVAVTCNIDRFDAEDLGVRILNIWS
ncbi:MAG: CubicO group peptidase (beta-lactamase class C family) [Ilumatobacter sp.]|jgi:CubicO group peptidase (beta-lactamase class C family)